jgi:hypothetical protein
MRPEVRQLKSGDKVRRWRVHRVIGERLTYANVIATLALFLALGGGSFAFAALSNQDKRVVKRIANEQITARAPTLSVKSARNVTNQMWAIVNADGGLVRSTPGITGASRDSTGKYLVSTTRDVGTCYSLATLGGGEAGQGLRGDISVNSAGAGAKSVFVLTSSEGGVNADRPFTIVIRC